MITLHSDRFRSLPGFPPMLFLSQTHTQSLIHISNCADHAGTTFGCAIDNLKLLSPLVNQLLLCRQIDRWLADHQMGNNHFLCICAEICKWLNLVAWKVQWVGLLLGCPAPTALSPWRVLKAVSTRLESPEASALAHLSRDSLSEGRSYGAGASGVHMLVNISLQRKCSQFSANGHPSHQPIISGAEKVPPYKLSCII